MTTSFINLAPPLPTTLPFFAVALSVPTSEVWLPWCLGALSAHYSYCYDYQTGCISKHLTLSTTLCMLVTLDLEQKVKQWQQQQHNDSGSYNRHMLHCPIKNSVLFICVLFKQRSKAERGLELQLYKNNEIKYCRKNLLVLTDAANCKSMHMHI